MSTLFRLNTSIGFVVEERMKDYPAEVNFAWFFDTREEANRKLIELVSEYGLERFYTAYICIG